MKERLINENWYFHLEDELYKKTGNPDDRDQLTTFGFFKTGEAEGFAARRYEHHNWRRVTLPHDYAVELDFNRDVRSPNGLKPVNDCMSYEKASVDGRANAITFPIAWYRKTFFMTEDGQYEEESRSVYGSCDTPAPEGKRYFLRFEGVYRDFMVIVNGVYMDRMTCGYLPLTLDVTDQLIFGETNTIAVRLDCSQYDGWWYDGAGICRDVKLIEAHDYVCHREDLYVHTKPNGEISLAADIDHIGASIQVGVSIAIEKDGRQIAQWAEDHTLTPGKNHIAHEFLVENPALWDIDDPQLYALTLSFNGEIEQRMNFGFKDVRFSPCEGFFLNGKSRKLNGVCLHGDFAGLGVALPYEILFHKYKVMKEMGVNAVRTSHNPPAPDVLDICDRLGILLMDETRMFGSSAEAIRQLEGLVRRDRNHACILMWSVGNEEHTVQDNEWGARMARSARRIIESLTVDPIISYGGNNASGYHGINEQMDLRGINYIRINSDHFHPDDYHADHPHQPVYSSEEMSSVTARGIYKNDLQRGYVDAYGNNTMPWASSPQGFLQFCANRPYYCGSFAWTGFDYRGEASPFTGSISEPTMPRNTVSNFGIVDLCGFPKDTYYHYRAWWRPEPLLHLLPDWNGYDAGEMVRVVCFTNCEEVTLYLNGREISTLKNPPYGSPEWQIPYEQGELKAIGRKGEITLTAYRRSDESTTALRITADDYGKYIVAAVDAVDRFGEICNSDNGNISVACDGVRVLGVGNGDPASYLRERYYEEAELHDLPGFAGTDQLPMPSFRGSAPHVEEQHPRFDDRFRIVWKQWATAADDLTDRSFSIAFTVDGVFDFIEFPAVLGEAQVLLDDVQIGVCNTDRRRPFRFHTSVQTGRHTLCLRIRSKNGAPTVLSDAKIGKYVMPAVTHKLFNGRMLLILQKETTGKLLVTHESGISATLEIS